MYLRFFNWISPISNCARSARAPYGLVSTSCSRRFCVLLLPSRACRSRMSISASAIDDAYGLSGNCLRNAAAFSCAGFTAPSAASVFTNSTYACSTAGPVLYCPMIFLHISSHRFSFPASHSTCAFCSCPASVLISGVALSPGSAVCQPFPGSNVSAAHAAVPVNISSPRQTIPSVVPRTRRVFSILRNLRSM